MRRNQEMASRRSLLVLLGLVVWYIIISTQNGKISNSEVPLACAMWQLRGQNRSSTKKKKKEAEKKKEEEEKKEEEKKKKNEKKKKERRRRRS
ncbi:hypothetical protein M8J76_011269 [Diaphorina citri]|nr:hypothetical protein M8J76_011269 [Diaphorina citri]